MSVKREEVDVRYCDICGLKVDSGSEFKCWKCGRDCCGQHTHLVHVEGGVQKMVTYLCDDDREEMQSRLRALFQEFKTDKARRDKEEQGDSNG